MTWAAVAIGAGSLLGGVAAGSGGKKADTGDQEAAAKTQRQIALQLLGQTAPLREAFVQSPLTGEEALRLDQLRSLVSIRGPEALSQPEDAASLVALEAKAARGARGILPDFLRTGELPLALQPLTTPTREAIARQFGVARENILSRTPARGGQLNEALTNLEGERAFRTGVFQAEAESPIRQLLIQIAANMGLGAPTTALAGLGSAGAQFGQIAQQSALQQQAQGEAFGSSAALATKLALNAFGSRGTSSAPFAGQGNQPILLQ